MDRHLKICAFAWVFACLAPAFHARADSLKSTGTVWSTLEQVGAPEWQARALKATIDLQLSTFHRIIVEENFKSEEAGCDAKNIDCLLRAARKQNVNLVIIGDVKADNVALRSYETWTHTLTASEDIAINESTSLEEFRHRIFRLVKPLTEIGGLIDQHTTSNDKKSDTEAAPRCELPPVVIFGLAPLLLVLFFLPRVVISLLAKSSGPAFTASPDLNRMTFMTAFGLPLAWSAILIFVSSGLYDRTTAYISVFPALCGGVFWALSFVVVRRAIIPKVHAMEEVSHAAIFPVIRAWVGVTLGRLPVFLLATAPFVIGAIALAKSFDAVIARYVVFPVALVAGSLWYSLWVFHLAVMPENKNPPKKRVWRDIFKNYFLHYLDRRSIDVSDRLFLLPASKTANVIRGIVVAFVAGALTYLAAQSFKYHSTYVERMDLIKKQIELKMKQERRNGTS